MSINLSSFTTPRKGCSQSYKVRWREFPTGKKEGTRKNRRFYCMNGTVLDADWNAAINIARKSKHPSSFKMPLDGALSTWKAGCKSTTQSYISLPAATTGAVQAHAL